MLRTLINQRLGRYAITELLGRGGMAAVYRATDTVLKRDVALKVLYPQYSDDQSLIERFTREAITAAALEHLHIVPVYDVGEHEGMAYIAMKLLSGETLQDLLQRAGAISPDTLGQLLAPVAAALDYAHRCGVIHRDIKPGNIFLCQTPSGLPQVMLTDFGIAKRLDAPGLTTTGALIGTPDYMAPEQIAGRPVDARTDVYALGMLAYRALTGRRAFDGTAQDVLMGHLYRQPPLPSSVAPDLLPALDAVLLRAVATSPADRFPSAGAFVQALLEAAGTTPVGLALPTPPVAQAIGAPPLGINSAPTVVNPALQAARIDPPFAPLTPTPAPATHTTISDPAHPITPGNPRSSTVPWIMAIILALLAGGLAVALGFSVGSRQGSSVAGGAELGATPTPSGTAAPTLAASVTPDPALGGAVATVAPTPSPTSPGLAQSTPRSTSSGGSPAETATAPPTTTVSPSETATTSPSPTLSPTATASATPTVDCTEGMLNGGFGQLYRENVAVRTRLGCPKVIELAGQGAIQFFQAGTMFYWGLNPTDLRDTIIVFYGLNSGTIDIVSADETASYPEVPPSEDPNSPVRGFGRVYYGKASVSDALGIWKSPEFELKGSTSAVIQFFKGGTMVYTPIYKQPGAGAQAIFVLYADGTFERYNDPSVK